MSTRVIETEQARDMLVNLVKGHDLPMTVEVRDGRKRSMVQNALAFKWYLEIAGQLGGQTADDVRAQCKLDIGVPILLEESERFREVYNRVLAPLPYEDRLEFIKRTKLPVTSIFGVKQMVRYMDELQRTFAAQGVILTNPDDQGR